MEQRSDRDEWLMAQTALGKREPLEPLLRRHASPLLTFIQRMVGDRHRSEELFQEVFLAVWVKRRQYQFPRPFKAWLYAIALNKCRASYRQRTRSFTAGRDDAPGGGPAPAPVRGGPGPPTGTRGAGRRRRPPPAAAAAGRGRAAHLAGAFVLGNRRPARPVGSHRALEHAPRPGRPAQTARTPP